MRHEGEDGNPDFIASAAVDERKKRVKKGRKNVEKRQPKKVLKKKPSKE